MFGLILMIFSVLILTNCVRLATGLATSTAKDKNLIGRTEIVEPLDYGNYVYYFPVSGADFGNSLSAFIEKHPKLRIVTSASDGAVVYGPTVGYFVICEKIK